MCVIREREKEEGVPLKGGRKGLEGRRSKRGGGEKVIGMSKQERER